MDTSGKHLFTQRSPDSDGTVNLSGGGEPTVADRDSSHGQRRRDPDVSS
jgi:hypothetical protein